MVNVNQRIIFAFPVSADIEGGKRHAANMFGMVISGGGERLIFRVVPLVDKRLFLSVEQDCHGKNV